MTRWPTMAAAFTLGVCAAAAPPRTVSVDASKVSGTIRSLQGVNLGPLHTQPNLPDLTLQYRDLWIDSILIVLRRN